MSSNQPGNNDGNKMQGQNNEQNAQMNMAMNPNMPNQQMGYQPGMMGYPMPNFMQHLQGMATMPGGPMSGGMYPGNPAMGFQNMPAQVDKAQNNQNMNMAPRNEVK